VLESASADPNRFNRTRCVRPRSSRAPHDRWARLFTMTTWCDGGGRGNEFAASRGRRRTGAGRVVIYPDVAPLPVYEGRAAVRRAGAMPRLRSTTPSHRRCREARRRLNLSTRPQSTRREDEGVQAAARAAGEHLRTLGVSGVQRRLLLGGGRRGSGLLGLGAPGRSVSTARRRVKPRAERSRAS